MQSQRETYVAYRVHERHTTRVYPQYEVQPQEW